MQAKKSILSLAIVSLFAAAGAALAYGPGPQGGGMRMGGPPADAAQHAERMQLRLAGLKDELKLQPNQLDAWNAWEARIKAEGQVRFEMRQAMHRFQGDAQAFADQRVAMMKHRAQAADEINGLRKALVATLTPEQKATFDQHSMGPRMRGGPGAHGGKPGQGPGQGYGPGAGGGRGPGYGRS
jgi:Spy/CpxP family protein refolding chaperone